MAAINNREVLAQQVIATVKKHNGMLLGELVRIYELSQDIDRHQMDDFVQSMVKECKLIGVEYTMDMSNVGMFLLPHNSRVNVMGIPPSPPRRVI